MGLAISHDIYNGNYDGFNQWKIYIAHKAQRQTITLDHDLVTSPITGIPTFFTAELVYVDDDSLNQPEADDAQMGEWRTTPADPLEVLFLHSDAEGYIYPPQAIALADALENILPRIPIHDEIDDDGNTPHEMTIKFIKGLRLAAERDERVVFA